MAFSWSVLYIWNVCQWCSSDRHWTQPWWFHRFRWRICWEWFDWSRGRRRHWFTSTWQQIFLQICYWRLRKVMNKIYCTLQQGGRGHTCTFINTCMKNKLSNSISNLREFYTSPFDHIPSTVICNIINIIKKKWRVLSDHPTPNTYTIYLYIYIYNIIIYIYMKFPI